MITKILLIDEDEFKEALGEFDVNIDPKKYKNSVKVVQDKFIREILGDKLYFDILENYDNNTLSQEYENLLEYIKQVIIARLASITLLKLQNQITNKGVMNRSADFSNPVNDSNLYGLINSYKEDGDYYSNRIYNHINDNKSDFPLYEEKSNDINPSKPSNDFGIWSF